MKVYKLILLVLVLGGMFLGYKYFTKDSELTYEDVCRYGQVESGMSMKDYNEFCSSHYKGSKSDLEKILDEELFRKETLLRARVVANNRKKEQEEKRHQELMAQIEQEYEAIRTEEMQLVGGQNVSLK